MSLRDEAETIEQMATWLESRNRPALMNPETLKHLADNLRNFSPDPDFLERERLESAQEEITWRRMHCTSLAEELERDKKIERRLAELGNKT